MVGADKSINPVAESAYVRAGAQVGQPPNSPAKQSQPIFRGNECAPKKFTARVVAVDVAIGTLWGAQQAIVGVSNLVEEANQRAHPGLTPVTWHGPTPFDHVSRRNPGRKSTGGRHCHGDHPHDAGPL